MNTNTRDNLRRAGGVALTAAGIGLGLWLCLILADVLSFWWLFSSLTNTFTERGVDENVSALVALGFGALGAIVTHGILWQIIRLRKQSWVPRVAILMSAWYVAMYFTAIPYAGSVYNPFSGEPRSVYYRDNGLIIKMPKGAKTGPEGQKLEHFDEKVAAEFAKQQKEQKQTEVAAQKQVAAVTSPTFSDFLSKLFTSAPEGPQMVYSREPVENMEMWSERIATSSNQTIVFLAARGQDGKEGNLTPMSPVHFSWNGQSYTWTQAMIHPTYLADEQGHVYDLVQDSTRYDSMGYFGGPFGIGERVWPEKTVRVAEIYHFALAFKSVDPKATGLKLYATPFKQPLELKTFFASATQIPAVATKDDPHVQLSENLPVPDTKTAAESITNNDEPISSPQEVEKLRAPRKVKDVRPVYPSDAILARIEGDVQLQATVTAEGKVVDVKVLKSIPQLNSSAIEAVRQWEYAPTYYHGTPAAVVMTVNVRFALD